jgi:hypothetical protein
MGIFGFLSKAHMDQGIVSGDAIAKVSLYDEKISVQKDIVKSSKAMLAQMDQQVNDIMTKGDSEKSVERSVAIRKQQSKERIILQKDIENANKEIQKLNEERAPLAAETRKIEAEVGPIKYIAALIYGDNADQNMLESSVRWVIIMLVAVFDPLALVLVVAANQSKEWDENIDEENKLKEQIEHEKVMSGLTEDLPKYEQDDGPISQEVLDQLRASHKEEDLTEINHLLAQAAVVEEPIIDFEENSTVAEKHPYLNEPFKHFENTQPIIHKPEVEDTQAKNIEVPDIVEIHVKKETNDEEPEFEGVKVDGKWVQTGPTLRDKTRPKITGDYVEYDDKYMHKNVFAAQYPDLFLKEDGLRSSNTGFGVEFPSKAELGDMFVRVDAYPNRIYKFNGKKWIETSRENSNSQLSPDYLEFLISKLATGEYDPEMLTQNEQDAITDHIKLKKG